jgi:uncharacterized membrane protein YeaQ/YmgE (transglycosylase-associated protein family)
MNITLSELVVWVIVGALAGSLAGALVTFRKTGFGHWKNLAIGMAGAVIGGILFDLLRVEFPRGELVIRFRDVLAALIGALLILLAVWYLQRWRTRKTGPKIAK